MSSIGRGAVEVVDMVLVASVETDRPIETEEVVKHGARKLNL
jgi:hypothetical protein